MRRLAATAALGASLAAGCGADDERAEGGERGVTVPARSSVFVVGRDYSFDPSSVVVEGAGPLRIALRNEGSLAHNLKVLQGGRELGGTPTFQAGRTRSGTVDLRRGDYEMVCTVGNHEELGMVGTLEVR